MNLGLLKFPYKGVSENKFILKAVPSSCAPISKLSCYGVDRLQLLLGANNRIRCATFSAQELNIAINDYPSMGDGNHQAGASAEHQEHSAVDEPGQPHAGCSSTPTHDGNIALETLQEIPAVDQPFEPDAVCSTTPTDDGNTALETLQEIPAVDQPGEPDAVCSTTPTDDGNRALEALQEIPAVDQPSVLEAIEEPAVHEIPAVEATSDHADWPTNEQAPGSEHSPLMPTTQDRGNITMSRQCKHPKSRKTDNKPWTNEERQTVNTYFAGELQGHKKVEKARIMAFLSCHQNLCRSHTALSNYLLNGR